MGPRFSGKVREKFQRRERKWGGELRNQASAIRKPGTSEPIMETEKTAKGLSPHPFQPSRREEVKTRGPRLFAQPRPNEQLMKMILPSSLVFLQGWGLIDLPLRASNEGYLLTNIRQGGWCGLHCAHRATTVLSWGLCEHRDHASRLVLVPLEKGDSPEFPILFALT